MAELVQGRHQAVDGTRKSRSQDEHLMVLAKRGRGNQWRRDDGHLTMLCPRGALRRRLVVKPALRCIYAGTEEKGRTSAQRGPRAGLEMMIERGDVKAVPTGSAVMIPSSEADRLTAAL